MKEKSNKHESYKKQKTLIKNLIETVIRFESDITSYENYLNRENKLGIRFYKPQNSNEFRYYRYKGRITSNPLIKLFGIAESTAKRWLYNYYNKINQTSQPHVIKQIKEKINVLSDLPHVYNEFARIVNDLIEYEKKIDFRKRLADIFNKYLANEDFIGIKKLGLILGQSTNYIKSLRLDKSIRDYEEYSKYFALLTRIFLLKRDKLNIKQGKSLDKLKSECFRLIYRTMISRNLLSNVRNPISKMFSHRIKNRAISLDNHQLFILTLTTQIALTRVIRIKHPDLINDKRNNLFKLTEISKIITKDRDGFVLSKKFKYGTPLLRSQAVRLIKYLRKEFYVASKQCHDAIYALRKYFVNKRWYWKKYNMHFEDLRIPQVKILLDYTLGLNVFTPGFIEDSREFVNKSGYIIKDLWVINCVRHHIHEDGGYLIFFSEKEVPTPQFKLMPLDDSTHSILSHKSKGAQSLVVDKNIEIFGARLTHIFELINNSRVNDVNLNDFRNKIANIDEKNCFIWRDYPDAVLDSWITRLKNKDVLYKKYYPNFFKNLYQPSLEDFKKYNNKDKNYKNPEFWYWFKLKYLDEENLFVL
jgi:hypothetical protein